MPICGSSERDEGWDSHWDAHAERKCGLEKGHFGPHDYGKRDYRPSGERCEVCRREEATHHRDVDVSLTAVGGKCARNLAGSEAWHNADGHAAQCYRLGYERLAVRRPWLCSACAAEVHP